MRNASEVVREVGVDDFRVTTEQQLFHLDHRLLGIAPGTVRVLFRWKVGFEDRFQHQHRCCHADSIPQGRDAQRPEFAVGLRDEHSSDGVRSVSLLPERKRQFAKPPLDAIRLDVREVLTVYPRSALVGAALGECMGQNVVTANLVVQRVEAIAGFCLRFRVQRLLQFLNNSRLERMEQAPGDGPHAMVRLIARVIGVGIETADMLVHEVLSRKLRDRRAVARYAGLTGAPDESGSKRREKGLAKAGNARVRVGMIQLAWRFLLFQKDSALAQWYRTRTEGGRNRKTMIVALARKLLIALWRLVTTGEVPAGVVLRAA